MDGLPSGMRGWRVQLRSGEVATWQGVEMASRSRQRSKRGSVRQSDATLAEGRVQRRCQSGVREGTGNEAGGHEEDRVTGAVDRGETLRRSIATALQFAGVAWCLLGARFTGRLGRA